MQEKCVVMYVVFIMSYDRGWWLVGETDGRNSWDVLFQAVSLISRFRKKMKKPKYCIVQS